MKLQLGIGVPYLLKRETVFEFLQSVFTALWYPVDGTSMVDMMGGSPLTLSVDPGVDYIPATYAGTITAPDVQALKDADVNEDLFSETVIDGWFLPSQDELDAMHTNLRMEGVGNFAADYYWSSSEDNNLYAWRQVFTTTGSQSDTLKLNTEKVRPVRTFTAEAEAYSLRDVGPGGGLIFYIDGTTYYEAAENDISDDYYWSNITNVAIGTTGTAIGTGLANTNAIVAQTGHTASAAQACLDYSVTLKVPKNLSVSNLIDADLERIPVKYDNLAPHHIRMIGLFDPAVYATLTDSDKRKISNYMDLWVFYWGGWLDAGSVNKENRTI